MKRLIRMGVVAAAVAVASAPGLAAFAQPIIQPIDPNQTFVGEVNGNSFHSVLSVVGCSAGSASGSGTLLPGQTVEASRFFPPSPTAPLPLGFTGRAHQIRVDLAVALANPPLIRLVPVATLSDYNAPAQFPPGLSVPCDATLSAEFTPVNGGATAQSSTVTLTRESPAIVPSQPLVGAGQSIRISGIGWAPNSSYTVEECSVTSWIAPRDPCLTGNRVVVNANSVGQFTATFQVLPCGPTVGCFLGVPEPRGIDAFFLAGAAPIIAL
ncbi:MAG TPA: hypothetical protein VHA57_02675 [Actinomycetota bacterium]|nr:hypothetical protein [Actinomycetota bacterium]